MSQCLKNLTTALDTRAEFGDGQNFIVKFRGQIFGFNHYHLDCVENWNLAMVMVKVLISVGLNFWPWSSSIILNRLSLYMSNNETNRKNVPLIKSRKLNLEGGYNMTLHFYFLHLCVPPWFHCTMFCEQVRLVTLQLKSPVLFNRYS